MRKLLKKCWHLLTFAPLSGFLFQWFYYRSIQLIKKHFESHPEIEDIYLLSNLKSKDFDFGKSDMNILLLVKDDQHPKLILKQVRKFITNHPLLSLTTNTVYIPVVSIDEINISILKGFLLRNSLADNIRWTSLIKREDRTFNLGKQDHYAISYTAFQNLNHFFFNPDATLKMRLKYKNINRALYNLHRFYPQSFQSWTQWEKNVSAAYKLRRLPFYFEKHYNLATWKLLTQKTVCQYESKSLPDHLKQYLSEIRPLLQQTFVDDVIITPSLIQDQSEVLQGKLYLDIFLNSQVSQNVKKLDTLRDQLFYYQKSDLKLRLRFTTAEAYLLGMKSAFYPFPLEPLLRKQISFSLKERSYSYLVDYEFIINSSLHFLTTQFMRFRSLKQQSDLIGSKFIKSLNLMYRYHLLNQFLQGEELKVLRSSHEIRDCLTPQFSHLSLSHRVTEEDWRIISAQMKYLLKKIRARLAKYDDSLSLLKF